MSTTVPLWLVRKDLGLSLERGLPRVLTRAVTPQQMLTFCGNYRRMGIAELFLSGRPEGLFENLSKSARAFLFYLEGTEESAKATSKFEPFFDAVACGDVHASSAIAEHSRSTWNADEEYEEDFLYMRFLIERFALGATESSLDGLLQRYEQVLDSGDDPRLSLCQAFHGKAQQLFDETLDRMVGDRRRKMEKQFQEGQVSPNDGATVSHLWVELLALLRFAEQATLKLDGNHPFAPSVARKLELARLPPVEAWRDLPSFHDLT